MASIDKTTKGWRARWRTPLGQSRSKTFKRKADAETHLTKVESAKLSGGYIDTSTARVTLADWWERYTDTTSRRATTAARDEAVMRKWWLPSLADRRLATITPAHVRSIVIDMIDKLAASTVRTNVGVFRAVMNQAVEAELIARSPVRGIRLPAEQRAEPRFLTADELHHLADAVPNDYRAMIFLAAVLGLRWSEIAGLRVGRIDFLRRTVTVIETMAEVEGQLLQAPPKSKASSRTLSTPAELLDVLAEHLARTGRTNPDQLVFVAPDGGPLRATNFRRRVWAPAITATCLDGLTFHGLRHSAVGFMIAQGAHPRVIQRRAGHSSIRTTFDVYGRVLPEVDENVASALGTLINDPSRVISESSRVRTVSREGEDGATP
jgi:integrase